MYLFLLLFINIIYSDVWISYHHTAEYQINYSSGYLSIGKYNSEGISVGYEDVIYKSLMIGISYDTKPMKDHYSIKGASFVSTYLKYNLFNTSFFTISPILGFHLPEKDLKGFNKDFLYGLCLKLKNGIGINYILYELEQDFPDINNMTSSGFIQRYSINYSF